MRLVKDVIRAQEYHPDPKNPDYAISVTPDTLDHWAKTFNDMKAANIGIPLTFEHPPKGAGDDPSEWKQGDPRFRAGWVEEVYRDGANLVAVVDVPDEYAKDLVDGGCYVSPKFGGSWTDSEKRIWKNPIHHIALTTKPVALNQSRDFIPATKFSRDAADAFESEVMFSTSDGQFEQFVSEETEVSDLSPQEAIDRLFENPDFFELAAAKVDEYREHQFSNDMPGMPAGMPGSPTEAPAPPAAPEPDGDEGGAVALCMQMLSTFSSAIAEAMAQLAALAGGGSQAPEPDADDYQLGGDQGQAAGIATTPAVTAMSREQALASPLFAAMETKITAQERRDLQSRVDELFESGRCTGPVRDELTEAIGKYEFSRQNEVENVVLVAKISMLEKMPEQGAIPGAKSEEFSRRPVATLEDTENMTEERADEIVKSFLFSQSQE